jgi:NlpC/P60 family/Transglycosylase SLT domain
MTKLLVGSLVMLAGAVLAVPIGVALLVVAISGPAVAEQVRVTECASALVPVLEASATPSVVESAQSAAAATDLEEGGLGFALPQPGPERKASLTNPPQPIPAAIQALYVSAAQGARLPWTLLAGIGMAETAHGAATATSSAGAQGLMQFLPATFARDGVDGNGDGRAVITDDADSIATAAAYLVASGVTAGPEGVRRALFAYNHAEWYVGDVLFYAQAYGGGTVIGDPTDCGPGGDGNPDLPPLTGERVAAVLAWAAAQIGEPYVFGANGPDAWDCSSFTRAAYTQVGITMPRTAAAQRNWLAAGNGYRVTAGSEQPGDLLFWDSYLGPSRIGHVMIVWDPAGLTTIEAHSSGTGVGRFSYASGPGHAIFEIWRLGDVQDGAA